MRAKPPRIVAVHEAAHAAAVLAVGARIRLVWIDPSGRPLSGGTETADDFVPYSWQLAVSLAGPGEEARVLGELDQGLDMAGSDLTLARSALAGAPHLDQGAAISEIVRWLQLPSVAPVVERVAEELLQRLEAEGRRGEILGEELPDVAFGSGRSTRGLILQWGRGLRRAFQPAPPSLDFHRAGFANAGPRPPTENREAHGSSVVLTGLLRWA